MRSISWSFVQPFPLTFQDPQNDTMHFTQQINGIPIIVEEPSGLIQRSDITFRLEIDLDLQVFALVSRELGCPLSDSIAAILREIAIPLYEEESIKIARNGQLDERSTSWMPLLLPGLLNRHGLGGSGL